jgi:predicted nucleic acid-binding Zn finger protein
MRKYTIDGYLVTRDEMRDGCYARIWLCQCRDFDRRLVKFGQGFCAHVALALHQAGTSEAVCT